MRVFFDENMPRPLRLVLEGHDISYVEREGWKGKENGELLALVAQAFDVILTSDTNIAFQNDLQGLNLSLIVVPTNNLTVLRANALGIRQTLDELASLGQPLLVIIDWKGRRRMRRIDSASGLEQELAPVPPFTAHTI